MPMEGHNQVNLFDLDYIRIPEEQVMRECNDLKHTIVLDYDFFHHRQVRDLY